MKQVFYSNQSRQVYVYRPIQLKKPDTRAQRLQKITFFVGATQNRLTPTDPLRPKPSSPGWPPKGQQLRSLLFVTHNLREALSLAQRIVFLSPSPARIVLEHKVARRGLCGTDDPQVTTDYAALLSLYPQLLRGLHSPGIATHR